jgi:hypothetical protein
MDRATSGKARKLVSFSVMKTAPRAVPARRSSAASSVMSASPSAAGQAGQRGVQQAEADPHRLVQEAVAAGELRRPGRAGSIGLGRQGEIQHSASTPRWASMNLLSTPGTSTWRRYTPGAGGPAPTRPRPAGVPTGRPGPGPGGTPGQPRQQRRLGGGGQPATAPGSAGPGAHLADQGQGVLSESTQTAAGSRCAPCTRWFQSRHSIRTCGVSATRAHPVTHRLEAIGQVGAAGAFRFRRRPGDGVADTPRAAVRRDPTARWTWARRSAGVVQLMGRPSPAPLLRPSHPPSQPSAGTPRSSGSAAASRGRLVVHEADAGHERLDDVDLLQRRHDQQLQVELTEQLAARSGRIRPSRGRRLRRSPRSGTSGSAARPIPTRTGRRGSPPAPCRPASLSDRRTCRRSRCSARARSSSRQRSLAENTNQLRTSVTLRGPAAVDVGMALAAAEAVDDGLAPAGTWPRSTARLRAGDGAFGAGPQFLLEVADLGVRAGSATR